MFAAEISVDNNNLEETWLNIYCLFFAQFFRIVPAAVSHIATIMSIFKSDIYSKS
jgi:hypothetical protein